MKKFITAATIATVLMAGSSAWAEVKIANVAELSGAGAAVGNNWRDGIILAFDEINAAGGILGEQVVLLNYDTQTDPQTSRALVQKAVDDDAFVLLGTVYSASTIVNMLVAQQNGIPQITGSEAPSITDKGNPYIFRTSFGAQKSMPKVAGYIKDGLGVDRVAVTWVNNEFGKGGRDAFIREIEALGIEVVADISSEVGQADFAADVVKLKSSGAKAVFAYLHEEESARFLTEYRKQGVDLPLIGDSTLSNQKVVDLAGPAVNGVLGHVGLTIDAPLPGFEEFRTKYQARFGNTPDHNSMKGYIAAYVVKHVTNMVGEFDRQKFADTLHGLRINVADEPGVLMDIAWDDKGEVSRESFLIEVVDGKTVVKETLPFN